VPEFPHLNFINPDQNVQKKGIHTTWNQSKKMNTRDRVSLPWSAENVQSLLKQMTLEEKISLLGGQGFATTAAVPRVGIPSLNASS
jgi:hypothetical protein